MIEDSKIKIFITLSELGSFTKTATKLNMTQPAVSQAINVLESQLNVKLFVRNRSEIYLTSQGQTFLKYAQHINYWYNNLNCMFESLNESNNYKELKISANSFIYNYILSEILLSLSSKLGTKITLLDESQKDESDIHIKIAPSPKAINFGNEPNLIGIIEAVVISSQTNMSVRKAAVIEGENNNYKPFSTIAGIHVSNKFAVWDQYVQFLGDDILSRTAIISSSIESIKNIVKASSNIIGILPIKSVSSEIFEGSLLQMPIVPTEFTMDLYYEAKSEFALTELSKLIKTECKNCI